MTKLWLFDFDGTLVDSEKAIKECYLKVGQELVPERCSFIKTMVIGPSLDESARMILTDENILMLDEYKKRFQKLYDERIVYETPQYPKAYETLKQLHNRGDRLFIITNKRKYPTDKLINYYNWQDLFDLVVCIDEFPNLKNKSELLNQLNINKRDYCNIFMVGDTVNDGIAANNNNIPFILATYGYGKNEKWDEITVYKKINKINELIN